MDTALVVISLLSLGLAGALLFYAARLQQEQRERSEARVAALRAEIDAMPVEPRAPVFADEDPWDHRVPEPIAETVTAVEMPVALYGADAPVDDGRRRLLTVAGIGILGIGVLGATIYGLGTARERNAFPPAARQNAPLELVALRTERTGDVLSVTGTLHNPAASTPKDGLVATVFAFDTHGKVITSAQAPIDYQVLTPGDDSPFLVKVSGANGAARVRVSFRQKGALVPHTDRREK
jgi:hypothetical protein